jgi:hypothetical protein
MTEQEIRAAERKAIATLLQLDLLLLKQGTPQDFVDRALQLIETREWQANTNPDSTEI